VRAISDSAHAERIVAEHRLAGYDAIKVYSGVSAQPYGVLMRAANRAGIPVVGHVPVQVGLQGAVAAGQKTFEHAEDLFQTYFAYRMDNAKLDSLVVELNGKNVCVAPTLVVFGIVVKHFEQYPDLTALMAMPELAFVEPGRRTAWAPENNSYVRRQQSPERVPEIAARVREQFAFMKRITAALHVGGVPIVAGSDANVPFTIPGFSLHDELGYLVKDAGLTPHAALLAATRVSAECMGIADEVGTVAVGQRADLLLLNANPLDDVRHLKQRTGVMARGRWRTEAELQQRMSSRRAVP
jgi:imidazolonepropionase-like amidohydrolase